jgi:hypothetical protein
MARVSIGRTAVAVAVAVTVEVAVTVTATGITVKQIVKSSTLNLKRSDAAFALPVFKFDVVGPVAVDTSDLTTEILGPATASGLDTIALAMFRPSLTTTTVTVAVTIK